MKCNPYYRPTKFGLEIVQEISYAFQDSEFDLRVIWKNKNTGELLTSRSFGFLLEESIFENLKDEKDLEVVDSFVLDKLKEEAREQHKLTFLEFLNNLDV